jgi:hypothetical protein
MGLSGRQRKQLKDALVDAFPTKSLLEQILLFELDKNLEAIAGEGNLQEIIFKIIQTAEAEGWTEDLIHAARGANPGNLKLQTINQTLANELSSRKCIKQRFGSQLPSRNNLQQKRQTFTFSSSNSVSNNRINSFKKFAKNKLFIVSAIFIIELVWFSFYNKGNNSFNNPHPTEQSVNQTLNPSLNDNSKEPRTIKTSSPLQDGNVISLEYQGKSITNSKWLSYNIKKQKVVLDPEKNAWAKWKVHIIDNDIIALENLGVTNGLKWLALTSKRNVSLAPSIEDTNTGTKWKTHIIGDRLVALKNQKEVESLSWLDGKIDKDHSVGLAPTNIGDEYTGTKWRIDKG